MPSSAYRDAHAHPNGPGDARPTVDQILQDEGLLTIPNRLTGKTVLITGATSGLGLEVAKALHSTGAIVFISGRCDNAKGNDVAASVQSSSEHQETSPVRFIQMDQSDLDSVRKAATTFLSQSKGQLSLLICNAGVMAVPERQTTKQGHELQFGVNHLSHFLLFDCLREALAASSTSNFASRVIVVASCAHRGSGLISGSDYDFDKTPYDPLVAYGQSKTANVYMANEVERQFGAARNIHGLSVHPGVILETGLVKHMADSPDQVKEMFGQNPTFIPCTKSVAQGAGCILWAAVARTLEGQGGLYLEDCDVGRPVEKEAEWWDPGISEWCYDEAAEQRLWSDSRKIVEA